MAIAFALLTYEYHKTHASYVANHIAEPHYTEQFFGGLALAIGFLVSAGGFWLGSINLAMARGPAQTPSGAEHGR